MNRQKVRRSITQSRILRQWHHCNFECCESHGFEKRVVHWFGTLCRPTWRLNARFSSFNLGNPRHQASIPGLSKTTCRRLPCLRDPVDLWNLFGTHKTTYSWNCTIRFVSAHREISSCACFASGAACVIISVSSHIFLLETTKTPTISRQIRSRTFHVV